MNRSDNVYDLRSRQSLDVERRLQERLNACPRCGHPANWPLKIRVRLVAAGFPAMLAAGIVIGRLWR